MNFYYESFKEIRNQKKLKLAELARRADLTRATLWNWENGKVQPSEKKVRALARVLNIPVDKISDLKVEAPVSKDGMIEYEKNISSWISLEDKDFTDRKRKTSWHLDNIKKQIDESNQAIMALRTLINFSDAMLYVKDTSHRYIAASKALLNLVSLPDEQSIIGKTDKDLYPIREAKENLEEDEKVILSGDSVKNREGFVPGSRKQKWGLISKIPAFDAEGKISGLIGSFIDISRRKNAESLAETIKHSLNLIDKVLWFGAGDFSTDRNHITKNVFYISNSTFAKKFRQDKLSHQEQAAYFNSLKLESPLHDMKALKEKGVSIIRYRIKIPENDKILNIKASLYYDPQHKIYVGVIERDEAKDTIKNTCTALRELNVDAKIITQMLKKLESSMNQEFE